jgi:hypothetical protein
MDMQRQLPDYRSVTQYAGIELEDRSPDRRQGLSTSLVATTAAERGN